MAHDDTVENRRTRERQAEGSAGRAGGYCWVEHPDGATFCTRLPGHYPRLRHTSYYSRPGEEYD